YQLAFRGVFDRKVTGICTGENFGDIGRSALILKRPVMTVAHQAALLDVFARLVHHRQAIFGGEVDKLGAVGERKKRASAQHSALRSFRDRLKHRCACRFRSRQIDIDEIDSKRLGSLILCRGEKALRDAWDQGRDAGQPGKEVKPVTFPPGRDRFFTRPPTNGSAVLVTTMGMAAVTARAARAVTVPSARMTSTPTFTSVTASSGRRATFPSPHCGTSTKLRPCTQP